MTTAPPPESSERGAGISSPRRWAFLGRVVANFVRLAKDAGVRWSDDACHRLGASLSYYALFSLFPLLLLSVTGIGFVLGTDEGLRQRLVLWVASGASPESRAVLDQTLQSMQTHRAARGVGAVVGVLSLFLGSSGVFSELETALNHIWKVKRRASSGFWRAVLLAAKTKVFSFAVVVGASGAVLALLVASTALSAFGDAVSRLAGGPTFWQLGEAIASLACLTAIVAALYRIVPQTTVTWCDVFPGAFVTSVLFVVLKRLLAWYLVHLGSYAAYGAVGGVLGLMTWIYVASLVLFYGAEFSRVYAERFGTLRNDAD